MSRGGPIGFVLLALMLAVSLALWAGVPVAWLWVGGHMVERSGLALSLLVMALGAVSTIVALVWVLIRLNWLFEGLVERRGRPIPRHSAAEVLFVTTAVVAVLAYVVWFVGFSGASPFGVR